MVQSSILWGDANTVGEPAGVGVRLITDEAEFDSLSDNQMLRIGFCLNVLDVVIPGRHRGATPND